MSFFTRFFAIFRRRLEVRTTEDQADTARETYEVKSMHMEELKDFAQRTGDQHLLQYIEEREKALKRLEDEFRVLIARPGSQDRDGDGPS